VPGNPHFEAVPSWAAAGTRLTFVPVQPRNTAGCTLQSLRIHVRDHRQRELAPEERSLEACYGRFTLSQSRKGKEEARRWALSVSYGSEARAAVIAGHGARLYDHGPEPEPGDPDERMPAVVTWHDGEMFFLLASGQLPLEELERIARSLY